METFKGNNENILRKVKLILLIALTAIARKVITVDVKHVGFETELGISILILAICIGYLILNNPRLQKNKNNPFYRLITNKIPNSH
jgi:uncharacterized membrane protein (DUF373 family)